MTEVPVTAPPVCAASRPIDAATLPLPLAPMKLDGGVPPNSQAKVWVEVNVIADVAAVQTLARCAVKSADVPLPSER